MPLLKVLLWVVLLCVVVDFASPSTPGAFVFNATESIECTTNVRGCAAEDAAASPEREPTTAPEPQNPTARRMARQTSAAHRDGLTVSGQHHARREARESEDPA